MSNSVKFLNLSPPLVSPRLSKKKLSKSKYYKKTIKNPKINPAKKEHTYTQALLGNVKEILKIFSIFHPKILKIFIGLLII